MTVRIKNDITNTAPCTHFLDVEMELELTEGSLRNGYAGEDYTTHDPVHCQGLVPVYVVIHPWH